MKAPRLLPLLSLPLVVVGALLGHAAGYAAAPTGQDHVLHGYLAHSPFLAVVCLGMIGAALAQRIRGRLPGRPAAWPYAALPPLAFAVQELVERLATGTSPHLLAEPAVLLGLVAQLPLALAAYRLARLLLRCADAVSEFLAAEPSLAGQSALVAVRPLEPSLPRTTPACLAGFGRAPPRGAPSP